MTAVEFRATCLALFNGAEGWQSALARKLGVNSRTVRRWAKDGPPDHAVGLIFDAFGVNPPDRDFPRDEWIVGDGVESEREYVVHLTSPRFSARVVLVDTNGVPLLEEGEVNALSGVSFSGPDYLLCEFVWFDPAPSGDDLRNLLMQAAKALAK